MENIAEVTIETERLLLVPTTQTHAKEIFKEFTDEVTKYMMPEAPKEIEETQVRIESVITKRTEGKELQMTVLDKQTKEFLGCVGLHKIQERVPELGIRVKRSAHGKKIGREAVAALEAWGQKHLDFEYIRYPVSQENISSRKIAETLGGIVEKDEQGNEKVITVPSMDSNKMLTEVVYRIPKKG